MHDFADRALSEHAKAIPYGVYDIGNDDGWVNVADTAELAVNSIRHWWNTLGKARFPAAGRLMITADGGGSNSYRVRAWKYHLANLAAETGLTITVCHYPPGTSKWNKIEHRLFSFISMNWRGRPLTRHPPRRSLQGIRRHDLRFAQGLARATTHLLADLGSQAVHQFARLEGDLDVLGPAHALEREILHQRVLAVSGVGVDGVEEVLALVDALHAMTPQGAARLALRLGHDLARLPGQVDEAARVHTWGRTRMPPDDQLTQWELWWCRPITDTTSPPPGVLALPRPAVPIGPPTRLHLRVMVSTAEASLDGRPVHLSVTQLKLLVGLALEHPAPLHVEQVSDLLWPNLPATATRGRINALVYRLRGGLGDQGEVVWRDGDLLGIDPGRSDVDLWQFRRSLEAEDAERRRAVVSVRGLVCDAQFPYDERFVDERHQLVGLWLDHAGTLVRRGELSMDALGPALSALRLATDDLAL